jgi:hypothetical protein
VLARDVKYGRNLATRERGTFPKNCPQKLGGEPLKPIFVSCLAPRHRHAEDPFLIGRELISQGCDWSNENLVSIPSQTAKTVSTLFIKIMTSPDFFLFDVKRRLVKDVSHWPKNGGVLRGSGRRDLKCGRRLAALAVTVRLQGVKIEQNSPLGISPFRENYSIRISSGPQDVR